MTNLDPVTSQQTDPHARQQENLEWYVSLLCGDEPLPENPFARGPESDKHDPDLDARFAPRWRNTKQLFTHVGMRHYNNGHTPFAPDGVRIKNGMVCMRDKIGHLWRDEFSFDDKGNFASLVVHSELANGYKVRLMETKDIQDVEDMNQVARIQVGDGSCTIDRKGTTRAYLKLLEDNLVAVVDDKSGQMVSVGAAAFTTIRIGGNDFLFQYTNHFRTHKDHRHYAMMRTIMSKVCVPKYEKVEGTLFVMHGGNDRMLNTAPSLWKTGAFRAVFDCAAIASEPADTSAKPDEISDILAILNGTHQELELYCPYSAEALRGRLERCPDAYGWNNLKRTDKAVLGTWFSGEERHYEMPGKSWTETRGLILDYGATPDGHDDLEALIRSAAAEALNQDITHLTLFLSERSPIFNMIKELADHLELYRVNCSFPELEGTSERGIYIDPILA